MNDPNKAIEVNLSSLLSLKAELLRKQAEVSKAKTVRVLPEDFTPNKTSSKKLEKCPDKRQEKSVTKNVCEYEDSALLEKSKKTLEAKSKYYDQMVRSGSMQNVDENCLVQFHHKEREDARVSLSENHTSSESDAEDDNDWVEYTDCLGRTRKCLLKDLEVMKKRDKELAASMPERLDQSKPNWMLDVTSTKLSVDKCDSQIGPAPPESIMSEGLSIMSKHDEMRANWEKKQEENLEKPSVHYQDVFFDEARQHGVGYYAFSTDEAERMKQQRELAESRKHTIAEQEKREKLRAQREKIIAERVLAAKNRQRARLGLPPLSENCESEKNEANEDNVKKETKEERRERKLQAKLKQKQEKLAAAQELERKHHLRPWDKGKTGANAGTDELPEESVPTEWHYKPERLPMSQEEWNEHKRAERNPEFAPVSSNENHAKVRTFRTNFKCAPIDEQPNNEFEKHQRITGKKFQCRSYQNDYGNFESPSSENSEFTRGAAIPPPADLDLEDQFRRPPKKSKSNVELERSIEAGLRFLRNNSDKTATGGKSSWVANADY